MKTEVTVEGTFITHPLLGRFKRTFVRRVPNVGEYYLGTRAGGICCAKQPDSFPHEILERAEAGTAAAKTVRLLPNP
jgi:hypothetical protein